MRVVNFSESFRMTCAARPKSPSATMRIEEVPPNTTNKYLTSSHDVTSPKSLTHSKSKRLRNR